jgi:hypothetical protein
MQYEWSRPFGRLNLGTRFIIDIGYRITWRGFLQALGFPHDVLRQVSLEHIFEVTTPNPVSLRVMSDFNIFR